MYSKIETERLILREWKMEDIDILVDGLNHFDTAKNLTVPFPYTKEHAVVFIGKHLKNNKKSLAFAITLKETNQVIGGTSIDYDETLQKYKGGIWLHRDFTKKGYGTETWRARAKYAFETFDIDELENGFYEFNNASWHMQQKVGYKQVGKKPTFCPALQSEVVEIITRLKKEDLT